MIMLLVMFFKYYCMNYKLEGNGKTLVFIHGLSDNLLYWEPLSSILKKSYQVLRVDLRGHGDSELGNDKISSETYVTDLKNLLDELNISDVDLIGFSLGGAVALEFSVKYPQMVNSLVLMSSFCKVEGYLYDIFNQFKNSLNISFEEFYDLILPMVLCPEVIEDNLEELRILKEISCETANTEAYIKAIDAFKDFNMEKELIEINIPTLILAGKYDELTRVQSQKAMMNKIKNSKLIVFDNTKHNLLVGKNIVKIIEIIKKEYE